MVQFKQKGVTTIIWAGGLETKQSQAAALANYRPEMVLAGDRLLESRDNATYQDKSVWDHAVVVSNVTKKGSRTRSCASWPTARPIPTRRGATSSAPPASSTTTSSSSSPASRWPAPGSGPTSIDKGYHAIPHIASTNPKVPACFYNDNDYTCVKDACDVLGSGRAGPGQPADRLLAHARRRQALPDRHLAGG